VESTGLLGHVLLVTLFVHSFFLLEISELFDLVMVDHQSLSIDVLVVEGSFGHGGGVWGLEANESEDVVGAWLLDLDTSLLGLTELSEDLG